MITHSPTWWSFRYSRHLLWPSTNLPFFRGNIPGFLHMVFRELVRAPQPQVSGPGPLLVEFPCSHMTPPSTELTRAVWSDGHPPCQDSIAEPTLAFLSVMPQSQIMTTVCWNWNSLILQLFQPLLIYLFLLKLFLSFVVNQKIMNNFVGF